MSLLELLAHPVCRLVTLALVHFIWQGLAIALLLVLIVGLCGIRRANTRYACSLAALALMVAMPLLTLGWLSTTSPEFAALASRPPLQDATGAFPVTSTLPTGHWPLATGNWPLAIWLQQTQPYLLAAWLTGVILFGGRLSAGAIGLAQLRHGRQLLPLELAGVVQRLGDRMAIDALPLVFLSRQVAEAMAVGVFRPLVLVPASWATEMPLEMLEAVIAHELAHLRRRDLLINLLQRIAETLLFYHPAVWWLSRRLRIERELCADELAVAATGNRLVYAQALEQVAHWRRAEVRPALAAFLRGESNMLLLERVQNVLGVAVPARRDSRLWPAGIIALALPLGMWALSIGLPAAVADDEQERDKPAAEREPGEREIKRRIEIRLRTDADEDREQREEARKIAEEKAALTELFLAQQQLKTAELSHEAANKLREKGIVTDLQVEAASVAAEQAKRSFEAAQAKLDALRGSWKREKPRAAEDKRETIERKIIRKEGDTGDEIKEGTIRKPGPTEATREDLERKITRMELRQAPPDNRIDELAALVKRLSAQVERLQDEVASLRGERGRKDLFREGPSPTLRKREPGDAATDRREDAELLEQKLRQAAEERERAAREREARGRAREQEQRKEIEARELDRRKQDEARRDRDSDEQALRLKYSDLERLAELQKLDSLKLFEDIGPLIERQRALAEEQAAKARVMAEKAAAQAREAAAKAAKQSLEQAEKAKEAALEAVKKALDQKKELEIELKLDNKEKPDKEKPDKSKEPEKNDDGQQ
jgi:beta-lactamase regulating signal transducer with metallopeptidase domain